MSLTIIATLDFHPDDIAKILPELGKVITPTLSEKGCHHYSYGQDVLEPNLIRIAEWWEDEESLAAHLKTPHVVAFIGAVGRVRLRSMNAKKYTVSAVSDMNPSAS